MAGLFHVCQGTCLCATAASDSYGKGKVLYCYGEVVLQRSSLRKGVEEDEVEKEMFTLQIAQLIAVAILLLAVLIVLISIRQGLKKIQGQIKKILFAMSSTPKSSNSNTLEKKKMDKKTPNGDCPKYSDKEDTRLYNRDRCDSLEVVTEAHGTPVKSVAFAAPPVKPPAPQPPPIKPLGLPSVAQSTPVQSSVPSSQASITLSVNPRDAFIATLVEPIVSSSPSVRSPITLTSSSPFPSSTPVSSSPPLPSSTVVPSSLPLSASPPSAPHLSAIQSLINEVQNKNFSRAEQTPPLPSPPPSPPKYLPSPSSSPTLPPPPPPYFCSSSPSPTYTFTCSTALQPAERKVTGEGMLAGDRQLVGDRQLTGPGQLARDGQASAGPRTTTGGHLALDGQKRIYHI